MSKRGSVSPLHHLPRGSPSREHRAAAQWPRMRIGHRVSGWWHSANEKVSRRNGAVAHKERKGSREMKNRSPLILGGLASLRTIPVRLPNERGGPMGTASLRVH